MKFTLEIELGNKGMRWAGDVERALKEVGRNLNNRPTAGDEGKIKDINGNTVGKWKVVVA